MAVESGFMLPQLYRLSYIGAMSNYRPQRNVFTPACQSFCSQGGGLCQGDPSGQRPPWTETPTPDRDPQTEIPDRDIPLGRDPPGQSPPDRDIPLGRDPLDRDPSDRDPQTDTP